jgi:hypothetical protein
VIADAFDDTASNIPRAAATTATTTARRARNFENPALHWNVEFIVVNDCAWRLVRTTL